VSRSESTYLTTGLDPDESVDQRVASVGSWARTKASTLDIAPVAPCLLAGRLLARTSDIDNEARWEALSLKKRCESLDKALLIAVVVRACDSGASSNSESVVV
jgi:hypothetical protein